MQRLPLLVQIIIEYFNILGRNLCQVEDSFTNFRDMQHEEFQQH